VNTSATPRRPVPPGGVAGLRGRRDALAEDGVLAAVLAALAFAPELSKVGTQVGDLPGRPADALSVVLALAQTLPLAARRRFPAVVLTVIGAAFAVDQARGYPTTFASLGLYLALYSTGVHQERLRRTAAAATAGYVVLALVLHQLGSPQGFGDYFVFYLCTAAAWLAGGMMRRLREQEAERRRLPAEAATAAERARIARELHDVVTHHVTAMVVSGARGGGCRGSPGSRRHGDGRGPGGPVPAHHDVDSEVLHRQVQHFLGGASPPGCGHPIRPRRPRTNHWPR
jgi:hypothetical protein